MLLKLENVEKNYGSFHLNCSLYLKPGYITGLMGPNGAGKTTLFKAALGLTAMDSGIIEVFGTDVKKIEPKDKENIGVVLADSGFSGYLTIKDLLPVMERLYTRFSRADFIRKCEELGLPLNKKIKEFSTGMKAKLKVLSALSHGADLLIMDEPTSGLDVIARNQLLDYMRSYMEKDGRAILVSSHISSDLEGFCDDLYLIDNGSLVLHEETDVLLSDYGVLKLTEEQFAKVDQTFLIRHKKEDYGYSCLTNQKQYYQENCPGIVIEKGTIDNIITMMIGGEP